MMMMIPETWQLEDNRTMDPAKAAFNEWAASLLMCTIISLGVVRNFVLSAGL